MGLGDSRGWGFELGVEGCELGGFRIGLGASAFELVWGFRGFRVLGGFRRSGSTVLGFRFGVSGGATRVLGLEGVGALCMAHCGCFKVSNPKP